MHGTYRLGCDLRRPDRRVAGDRQDPGIDDQDPGDGLYNGAYTSLPAQIAKNLGFYEKYKLDAELVVVNSGPAGVAALLGGSLDFVEPPTDQIITNQIKGTDLKVVVGNEVKNFFNLVVSQQGQAFRPPAAAIRT